MKPKESNINNIQRRSAVVRLIIFLCLIASMMVAVRYFQLEQYLETERLRQLVAAYGVWGPIIYLAIWTVGPPLCIPATPILMAGGVVFGPFWGEVYVLCGATAGAIMAFLVARYLARDWVASKLSGTRLKALDELVARQGWKIVALSRLIPIFPYFLVNYAFGLTGVSLWSFTFATFFGMFPLTMAYVYFSANLLDLFLGKFSWQVIIGVLLLALVSILPLFYNKIRARRGEELEL
jgi:uncharacterized membrane protein YdjX (TVP38/TMEM64 family)